MACPDPVVIVIWRDALTLMSGLLPLATLWALVTAWRVRRVGMVAVLVTSLSAVVAAVAGISSGALWLRFRETIASLTAYFPLYPSSCMNADDYYEHFSPPPVFYQGVLQNIAKVAPLEHAVAIDVAVAIVALAVVIACALTWGRRTPATHAPRLRVDSRDAL